MSSVNKRQGRGHFSKQEKCTKGRGNREKTDKERVSLSLILIEYLKYARNKRGQATYRDKQLHAIESGRAVLRTPTRAHARSK